MYFCHMLKSYLDTVLNILVAGNGGIMLACYNVRLTIVLCLHYTFNTWEEQLFLSVNSSRVISASQRVLSQKKDYNSPVTSQHLCPYARRAVEGFPVLPAVWSWEKWSAAAEEFFNSPEAT